MSGQKIIYTDEKGAICKQANGNELEFYQKCLGDERLKPFQNATPKMIEWFKLRKDIDRIDLVLDG